MRKRKKAHLLRDGESEESDDSGNDDDFKDCLDEKDDGTGDGGDTSHTKEKYPILMSKMNRLDKLMRAYRGIKDVSQRLGNSVSFFSFDSVHIFPHRDSYPINRNRTAVKEDSISLQAYGGQKQGSAPRQVTQLELSRVRAEAFVHQVPPSLDDCRQEARRTCI